MFDLILRILLTGAAYAYVLMQELRLRAAGTVYARNQVTWLRNRLLKFGVQVVRSVRRRRSSDHVASIGGNHAWRVRLSSLNAGSWQWSTAAESAISWNILAERFLRRPGAAHSIAVRMAPFGSEGFLSHGSQRPRELRWRRRFATSCPQPRIPEVCTRSPQTHTSSSGSMTIAFVRSAQPFLDRSVSREQRLHEILVRNEHDQVHGVDAPPHPITPVANNTFMSTDSCQCRRMG